MTGKDRVKIRMDGQTLAAGTEELDSISADAAAVIRTVIREYPHLIRPEA